jgi:hypothetical protein
VEWRDESSRGARGHTCVNARIVIFIHALQDEAKQRDPKKQSAPSVPLVLCPCPRRLLSLSILHTIVPRHTRDRMGTWNAVTIVSHGFFGLGLFEYSLSPHYNVRNSPNATLKYLQYISTRGKSLQFRSGHWILTVTTATVVFEQ